MLPSQYIYSQIVQKEVGDDTEQAGGQAQKQRYFNQEKTRKKEKVIH